MRFLSVIGFSILYTCLLKAQGPDNATAWIVDDFKDELKPSWTTISGTWSVSGENLTCAGASEYFALGNSQYIMRSKPYTIETSVKGAGGVMFCMENLGSIGLGHAAFFTGSALSTGYFDFHGKYIETRLVDYIQPSLYVKLIVKVDPVKRVYTVFIGERDVVLEDLRYISGYSGVYSPKAGVMWDYFQVYSDQQADNPSFFLKSNKRQIDHISYMTLSDEALLVANPVVGMVQRITSVGNFVLEVPVQGPKARPCGIFVDEERRMYIVDGGQNAVRIYNREGQLERVVNSDLNDPRGVTATNSSIFVLDVEGIKEFDRKGNFQGNRAAGMFKNPKNLTLANGMFYVADLGNGQVEVLGSDFSARMTIKDQLVNPWDVCIDAQSKDIYVADPGASAILHYNSKGEFLDRIDPITIKGFLSPRAVRIRENMIYVADFERILAFKKGTLTIRPALKIE